MFTIHGCRQATILCLYYNTNTASEHVCIYMYSTVLHCTDSKLPEKFLDATHRTRFYSNPKQKPHLTSFNFNVWISLKISRKLRGLLGYFFKTWKFNLKETTQSLSQIWTGSKKEKKTTTKEKLTTANLKIMCYSHGQHAQATACILYM